MFLAYLFLMGFVLLVFALPMWLLARHRRRVSGPHVDDVNYENPYPGAGMFASRRYMGDSRHTTRQGW